MTLMIVSTVKRTPETLTEPIATTGFLCCYAAALKLKWKIDDSVNSVSVHFVGGVWGTIMVGFFADKSFNPYLATTALKESGIFWSGRGTLLGNQILAALVTTIWSMVMTYIIVKVLIP